MVNCRLAKLFALGFVLLNDATPGTDSAVFVEAGPACGSSFEEWGDAYNLAAPEMTPYYGERWFRELDDVDKK